MTHKEMLVDIIRLYIKRFRQYNSGRDEMSLGERLTSHSEIEELGIKAYIANGNLVDIEEGGRDAYFQVSIPGIALVHQSSGSVRMEVEYSGRTFETIDITELLTEILNALQGDLKFDHQLNDFFISSDKPQSEPHINAPGAINVAKEVAVPYMPAGYAKMEAKAEILDQLLSRNLTIAEE